jgi:hypothetical protein
MILEYIKVAFGLGWVNVIGLVGGLSKRKCCRIGPNRPWGSIAKGSRILFWSRMLLMTVLPMVVIPVLGLVLLSHPSLFFSYFCRYELALAVKIFGNIARGGIEDRARRWAADGDIKASGCVGACMVDLRWGGRVWVKREIKGPCMWV